MQTARQEDRQSKVEGRYTDPDPDRRIDRMAERKKKRKERTRVKGGSYK